MSYKRQKLIDDKDNYTKKIKDLDQEPVHIPTNPKYAPYKQTLDNAINTFNESVKNDPNNMDTHIWNYKKTISRLGEQSGPMAPGSVYKMYYKWRPEFTTYNKEMLEQYKSILDNMTMYEINNFLDDLDSTSKFRNTIKRMEKMTLKDIKHVINFYNDLRSEFIDWLYSTGRIRGSEPIWSVN